MTPNDLKKAVLSVKRWSRDDQRAPNKPLMMIYALSEYIKGHGQMFDFESEVEQQVNELLRRFGPLRKSYHSLYGFWRLINDGFWRLDNADNCLPRKSNSDPPKSELVKYSVMGGFNDETYKLLKNNNNLAIELLELILAENFPESMIQDIFTYLALEMDVKHSTKRDPNFRREVLRAYNYQCAICGYDLRMDDVSFGLEAAHIKWKQFHGPCTTNNGLALCSIHHKAFDKGAFAITSGFKIRLSSSLNGGEQMERLFFDFENKPILLPNKSNWMPKTAHLEWHQKEVFK